MQLIHYLPLFLFITFSLPYVHNMSLSEAEQKKYKKMIEGQGLYGSDDDVHILTVHNFNNLVLNSPQAWLVEFYNSWCGFCQRFAPSWKALATDVKGWSDLVRIAAIDCSDDENTAICREYDIMGYPTLRFFSDHYQGGQDKIGETIAKGEDVSSHRFYLLSHLIEQQAKGLASIYPNLAPYREQSTENFFQEGDYKSDVKHGFVIVEQEPFSYFGAILALDLHQTGQIAIRTAFSNNTGLVSTFKITKFPAVIQISRDSNQATLLSQEHETRDELKLVITNHLLKHQIKVIDGSVQNADIYRGKWQEAEVPDMLSLFKARARQSLKERVKKMGDVVFQMDLETVLRHSLLHEVASLKTIEGEQLLALRAFVDVLGKYFPFGAGSTFFLSDLSTLVNGAGLLEGASIADLVRKAEEKKTVFSSAQKWMGCQGSDGKRGYPCGLWTLFHYLTVNSAEAHKYNEKANALEVLDTMFGYIKNFFGCSDCSKHFQEMALRRQMRNVTGFDSAILWLWQAHNEVNNRLSGDATEDAEFPKIQFPKAENCPQCRVTAGESSYDLNEVLMYLKRMYSSINVRYLGSDTRVLHLALQEAFMSEGIGGGDGGGSRSNGGFSSTPDSSMCFFLFYVCSFLLLAVVIRMFLKRGYRKKPYIHDLLGKV